MTPAQEEHLKALRHEVSLRLDQKYRYGANSHKNSDPLLSKSALELSDDIIDESIDAVVYSLTQRVVISETLMALENALNAYKDLIDDSIAFISLSGITGSSVIDGLSEVMDGQKHQDARELYFSAMRAIGK